MGKPIHENMGVVYALQSLSDALDHLNMAGHLYDIGVRGVDEPYGMVERACERILTHAFPDLDPERIMWARVESGEDFNHAVRHVRQETQHEREQAAAEAACAGRWKTGECREPGCCA